MAVHFHELKVKNIKKETDQCVSISFDIPPELTGEFRFKEGQNITIKKTINGEELRRSYSICSSPQEVELRVAVKKVEGGLFSLFANESLQPGDVLEVLPPTGKFNAKLTPAETGNYLALASGSGITPVISIIKHTLQSQPQSSFTLIYGNRSRGSIIFFEELEAIKNKYMQRFTLINILSREKTDIDINYGRINKEKLQALQKLVPYADFDSIYICGPEEMIFSSVQYFEEIGVDKHNIHFELFSTPGQVARNTSVKIESQVSAGPSSIVSLRLDGRTLEFPLAFDGPSILDAAQQTGADLPYACKGGVCASCRAKLTQGKVSMDVNYALEEEEVAAGFILTCQAHPLTDRIEVDFDIK
jgi:ring-1,2-phenylacetyl-CoA epoxidase subunit PaaE